jgi:hypothetical protein
MDSKATRNHDLIVVGSASGRRTLLDIEGKVDEPFDRTIQKALDSVANKPESKLARRIAWLSQSLLEKTPAEVGHIRYQLLQALGATLLRVHRDGAEQAVFVVHELVPIARGHRRRMLKRQAKNSADLGNLIELLSRKAGREFFGLGLAGPFYASGTHDDSHAPQLPPDLPFFIGKAVIEV